MKHFNIFKEIFLSFSSCLGFAWVLIQILDFFWGAKYPWLKSNTVFIAVFVMSLIYSVFVNYPSRGIRLKISGTEAYLSLLYGDILKSSGHIAVTTSNFFNTSPALVSERSLFGQVINLFFNGDYEAVEKKVSAALANIDYDVVSVSRGKERSYPIGTVAGIEIEKDKKLFLMAITKINETDGKEDIYSDISHVHRAINSLWDKAEIETDNGVLNIVPFGAGISRVFNRNVESVLYIAQSFIDRSKKKRPCSELIIFVQPKDICLSEFVELKRMLKFLA